MSIDRRPENCRRRLIKEGKPYPRSSCNACGKAIGNPVKCIGDRPVDLTDTTLEELAAEAAKHGHMVVPNKPDGYAIHNAWVVLNWAIPQETVESLYKSMIETVAVKVTEEKEE